MTNFSNLRDNYSLSNLLYLLIQKNYQLKMMQTKISGILASPTPLSLQQKGRLLYCSKVVHPYTLKQVDTQIFSKMIVIGSQYIPYFFQLRFTIHGDSIQFDLNDQTIKFVLPKKDQATWKQFLKVYLNQKGFHQQFKPMKKIGKGNFASVYLVQKIQNGLHYAVKAFSKEAAYSEQNGKECLIKEVEIMRQLDHKNTMKLYEVFQSDNSLYFVFQLIEGGQLQDKIKSKYKFKPNEIKNVISGLLQGLKEMHSKGIMHRDLKPQNILLRQKQSLDVVIADFGLAQFVNTEMYLFTRCGTPGFVAPEVINIKDMKAKYSSICDIFSLGLIFHYLLFGKSIFKAKSYNDLVKENRQCKFDFSEPEYSSVNKQTMDLMKKMLKINPSQRITAQHALSHPYFTIEADSDDQENQLENMDKIDLKMEKQQTMDSTPQQTKIVKKQNMRIKKDSCITFKLGKQSLMTGKLQTVQNITGTKVSMGNNLGKMNNSQIQSKFVNRNKQNAQNLPQVL